MPDDPTGPTDTDKTVIHRVFGDGFIKGAEHMARLHYARVGVLAFLAGLVAASAIAIPLILTTQASNRNFERANAIYDCHLFERASHWMGAFVNSDATLRNTQNKEGLGKKISADFEKIIPKSDLLRIAKREAIQTRAAVNEWELYARKLSALGSVDCVKHLGG